VRAVAPVIVWLMAIVAAVWLHGRIVAPGPITGYAEDRSVTLMNLLAGVVRDVRPRLHEPVEQGQIVARLDDRADHLALQTLKADLVRLEAEVDAEDARLTADRNQAMLDLHDLRRRFLIDREAAHIQYLSQMLADGNDRALLNGARFEHEIVQDLVSKKMASARELNLARTQTESLDAKVRLNQPVLARMKEAFDDADRRCHAFTTSEIAPVDFDSVLTAIRLAVDVRRREAEEIVLRIDGHIVRAPIHGQVTALFAGTGDALTSGAPLMVISPTATDRVIAYLPERAVTAITLGESIRVIPVATAGRATAMSGRVASLADVVSEAPLRYRPVPNWPTWGRAVVVKLDAGAILIPGESVTLGLEREPPTSILRRIIERL